MRAYVCMCVHAAGCAWVVGEARLCLMFCSAASAVSAVSAVSQGVGLWFRGLGCAIVQSARV